MPHPGDPIDLTSEQRTLLGQAVLELVIYLEAENRDLIDDKPIHRDWYNGTPDVPVRSSPWYGAPLSDDTEVLTDRGWVLVQDVLVGKDRVLSRDPGTGECAWMPVLARPEHHYDQLIHLKSKSVDQLVSPDHKVYVEKNDGSAWRFFRAEDLPGSGHWKIPLASSSWSGKNEDYLFDLPAGDVCEFIGWYIAEGWTYNSGTIGIAQDEKTHPDRCRHLEALMDRLGFSWSRRNDSQYLIRCRGYETGGGRYGNEKTGIYIPMELRDLLRSLGGATEKFIPDRLKNLSKELLERLLWGMVLGDGNLRPPGTCGSFSKRTQVFYYTSSKRLADDVQELAQKIGKRATMLRREGRRGGTIDARQIVGGDNWQVSFCVKTHAKLDYLRREMIPYGRKAYCLTTPWHTIYVRRNGVPSWTGNSNLVIPFIRTMADALIARAVLTIFATNNIWIGSSENEFYREHLDAWFDFLNYGARHGFDTFEPIHDLVTEMYIHGHGVIQQVWEDSQRYVVAPGAKRPTRVSLGRGPKLNFWPSEYILYNRENPIGEAEMIACQNNMTWGKLTREAMLCGWDEDSVAAIEGQQGLEGSAAQVRQQRREHLGLEATSPNVSLEPHDIREVLLDWPLFKSLSTKFTDIKSVSIGDHDPQAITTPIIVYLHRKTGRLLYALHHPYLLPEWNFYECRYRNSDSRGLAKILEHVQRGMTTIFNQAIDAVTMGNSLKFVTRDNKLLTRPFTPNQPVFTDDIEGIRELGAQKNVMPEIGTLQVLQAIGERVGGQSDPNFGRETRMGGHPQPATNFLGQQANSQVLNTLPMKSIRKCLSKIGEHRTILLQQFERNDGGWISQAFDEDTAEQIMEVLESDQVVSGQMRFDVKALSEVHNPEQEMNTAINTYQLFTQYATNAAQFVEVLQNPQASPQLKELMTLSVEGMGKMITKILETAGAEDAEDFVFRLQQGGANGQELIRAVGGQLRGGLEEQAGGAPGALPGPGLAALPGGAPAAPGGAARAGRRDQPY